MSKQAISVTLGADNLTWLKGRASATGVRSVSELLDRIVSDARGTAEAGSSRSVAGTIEISPADADLETADDALRTLFDTSLGRPVLVRETPRPARRAKTPRRRS